MQHYPGQGFRQCPGQGMQHYPGQGFRQCPGQGMQHYPGQGFRQCPCQGIQHYPGQGFRQRPGQGMQHYPGQGFQQCPGQGPRATQVRVPSILANRVRASSQWYHCTAAASHVRAWSAQTKTPSMAQDRSAQAATPHFCHSHTPPPPLHGGVIYSALLSPAPSSPTALGVIPGSTASYLLSAHLLTCWGDAAHSVRGKPASADSDTSHKCGRSTHTGGSAARQC